MTDCQALPQTAEYDSAISIAKRALNYIGTFRTPPVPEVYEVWYRFAEGSNADMCEQLSRLVKRESIGISELVMLREQYIQDASVGVSHQISSRLNDELELIHGLLERQKHASADFTGSINEANSCLQHDDIKIDDVRHYLGLVIESNLKLQEQMSVLDDKLSESKGEIEGLRTQLQESHKAITTDTLTGVGNRRFFESAMANAYRNQNQRGITYLFLIDLDNFKMINDQFGHAAGDEVLRFVASTLCTKTESTSVARYGGDEFAIVATFNDSVQATALATDLCSYFSENHFVLQRSGETVKELTLSIGAAMLRTTDSTSTWFDRSDKLLYTAKDGGRNRCMVERNISFPIEEMS